MKPSTIPKTWPRPLLDAGRCDRLLGNFEGAENRYEKALALLAKGKEGG